MEVEHAALAGPGVGERVDDEEVVALPLRLPDEGDVALRAVGRGEGGDVVVGEVGVERAAPPFGVEEGDPAAGNQSSGDQEGAVGLAAPRGTGEGQAEFRLLAGGFLKGHGETPSG